MIKKAVYAHYSQPYGSDIRNSQTSGGHWLFPYMEFIILAYSNAKSKEFFGHTALVTDDYGKKLIIDELQIPFDEVIVELDDCEQKKRFWAAGKIYGYTKAVKRFEPFVFFDNDAGYHSNPNLNGSPLMVQNIEHYEKTTFGIKFRALIDRLVEETPNEFPYDIYHEASGGVMKGCNCGVMAFNDETVLREFQKYVWALQNSSFFDKIEKEAKQGLYRHFNFWNVIVEQCLIYMVFKKIHNREPDKIFDFTGFDVPKGTPNPTRYFHIWGSKRDREFLKQREKLAMQYLDKPLVNRIHSYFGRPGSLK